MARGCRAGRKGQPAVACAGDVPTTCDLGARLHCCCEQGFEQRAAMDPHTMAGVLAKPTVAYIQYNTPGPACASEQPPYLGAKQTQPRANADLVENGQADRLQELEAEGKTRQRDRIGAGRFLVSNLCATLARNFLAPLFG